jgi:hypothetical protein
MLKKPLLVSATATATFFAASTPASAGVAACFDDPAEAKFAGVPDSCVQTRLDLLISQIRGDMSNVAMQTIRVKTAAVIATH